MQRRSRAKGTLYVRREVRIRMTQKEKREREREREKEGGGSEKEKEREKRKKKKRKKKGERKRTTERANTLKPSVHDAARFGLGDSFCRMPMTARVRGMLECITAYFTRGCTSQGGS